MPYTRRQVAVAEAVKAGWKPKGSAKGFGEDFAKLVVKETDDGSLGSMVRKAVKKGKRG